MQEVRARSCYENVRDDWMNSAFTLGDVRGERHMGCHGDECALSCVACKHGTHWHSTHCHREGILQEAELAPSSSSRC
jgi:hypothetical protein